MLIGKMNQRSEILAPMPVSSCHDDCIPLLLGHFSYSVPPCRGFSMGGHRLRWLGHFVRCFRHYFHHCFRWFHHYQNYHWHLNRSRHCFAATLHVEKDFGEPSCQRLLHMIDHEWNHLLKKKIDMARSSRIIKPLSLARWPHPPSCYLFGQHRKFLGESHSDILFRYKFTLLASPDKFWCAHCVRWYGSLIKD